MPHGFFSSLFAPCVVIPSWYWQAKDFFFPEGLRFKCIIYAGTKLTWKLRTLLKKAFMHIGLQAWSWYLRAPLTFELLYCSTGKGITDSPFAWVLMIIQKSHYGLDSNLWVKSVSHLTINLSEIAAELIIISMTGKVPEFFNSDHRGTWTYTGQYLLPAFLFK